MRETEVWTYQDAVDHIVDTYELARSGRPLKHARLAVNNAYRDLPSKTRWAYYNRTKKITTVASQSTGTVEYDHTGGTYERQLTLTDSTWPTWIEFGEILIDGVAYEIDEQKSSTVITLSSDRNPGADVAETTYVLYRSHYPLDVNFRRGSRLTEIAQSFELEYVPPQEIISRSAGNYSPGRPECYTIRNAGEYYGELFVEFHPPPSMARTYQFTAEVIPRQLRIEKESAGTVSVAANNTTVTGSGTAFTQRHVGCIIRFSNDGTNEPASRVGNTSSSTEPYTEQRVIASVASSTSLELDQSIDSTLSNVKYTISDPLDLRADAMLSYFFQLAEAEFEALQRADTWPASMQRAQAKLREAIAADVRHRNPEGGSGDQYYYDLDDWASNG